MLAPMNFCPICSSLVSLVNTSSYTQKKMVCEGFLKNIWIIEKPNGFIGFLGLIMVYEKKMDF